jgi:PAS domain S-box-containing protein
MNRTPFGEYVRERREALQGNDPRFSQRQVAMRIGIQPAYLSRIERGEAVSLSEEKIIALARELEEDPDVLLALAGKISSDVREAIRRRPAIFSSLIRDLDDLPDYAVLADKEYRKLENRLNEAQRLVRLGSWDRDLRSGEEYWSEQLYRTFGYQPGEVPPSLKTLLGHFLHVEGDPFRKALETLDPGFFEGTFTCRIVRLDGEERVVHVVAHLETDEEEVAVRVHGTLQDVTERVFWEEKYQEQTALLERIFSNIHLMIAYMDSEFKFIRVNQAYAQTDNRTPAFFVGRDHFDLFPHEENERIFRQVVETGEAHHAFAAPFEYAHSPERGVSYWDWSLTPVKGRDGSVEGLILTQVDVTEKVRAQKKLERLVSDGEQH